MNKFTHLFKRSYGVVIGMCHLQALPGSPMNSMRLAKITDLVLKEAEVMLNHGVDSIMIENMHDVPYVKSTELGPEVVASMAVVATQLRQHFPKVPIGIQILSGGNAQALAVAKCADLNFIRCESFVFSHVGDEGWMDACAGPLLRYRRSIDADHVLIFTDAKKKHSSHSVTSDINIAETARAMEFFLSDGIVVTGTETGVAAKESDMQAVQSSVDAPVLVGSGVTADNVDKYITASAFIIGSHFKSKGFWSNPVSSRRVEAFMKKTKELRT